MIKKILLTNFISMIFCISIANADITNDCGTVTGLYQNHNIELKFNFSQDCTFYTAGVQDLATEPIIIVDNENIKIDEIKWPEYTIKTEQIGDEKYKHSVINGDFVLNIPIKIKNKKGNKNFNITINYQICKDRQCSPETMTIKIADGKLMIAKDKPLKITNQKHNFIFQILIAFFGGIVLNFMPCVLPILGIKLASLSYGDKPKNQIKFAAILSLLGIIVSFIAMGLLASFIKLPFETINNDTQMWGSIFQNRYFILILTLLVALFIDIQRGRCNINVKLNNKLTGGSYHFLSGILSTVLASPCVAPVIGLSLVFSANASFIEGIIIFIAIGLGFGLPYIISFFYPDLYKKMPKNGLFSIWLERILGTLLFLTFFWLMYVIALQSGIQFVMVVMVGVFIFSHFGWKMKKKSYRLILFIAIIVPIFALNGLTNDNKTQDDLMWQKYSSKKLDKALSENNIVLVLGTADWCSWCHILEKTVLERTKFMDFIAQNNVTMLKADLTDSNDVDANEFYKSQKEVGLPILNIYSNNNPNGRSIIFDSFSVNSVINEIESEKVLTRGIDLK